MKNFKSILFGSGLTAIARLTTSAIGLPPGTLSLIGDVIGAVIEKIGVDIAAPGVLNITGKASKNILGLFKTKAREEPNHDLYKAFIAALGKALQEVYKDYATSTGLSKKELEPTGKTVNEIIKRLSRGTVVIDVGEQTMIELIEQDKFNAEDLLKATLSAASISTGFIEYFLKRYPPVIQKWFLEEIKTRPKAETAYTLSTIKEIKASLTRIDERNDKLDKIIEQLEKTDQFLSLMPEFPEAAFNTYLETQEPLLQEFFKNLNLSIEETLNRVETKIDKLSESMEGVSSNVNEIGMGIQDIKEMLIAYNRKNQAISPGDTVHLSISSYIRQTNPGFGKPSIKTSSPSNIRHLCSLPSGYGNLLDIDPNKVNSIDSISFNDAGKYIITFSKGTNRIIVWSTGRGEPVQVIEEPGGIVGADVDYNDVYVYTGRNEIVKYISLPARDNLLHGIEWKEKNRIEIPGLEKFKKPVICQVVPGKDTSRSKKAILIKESSHDEKYRGPSLVMVHRELNSWERNEEINQFEEYHFIQEDILTIRRVSQELFVSYVRDGLFFNTPGGDYSNSQKYRINDIALLPNDNELVGVSEGYGLMYLGWGLDPESGLLKPSKKEKNTAIFPGIYEKMRGGFGDHALLALQSFNKIKIYNPEAGEAKYIDAHTDRITRLEWGGSIGNVEFVTPTPLLEMAFTWKQRKGNYLGALLASASKDGTIKIWHVESGKEIACFENVSPVAPVLCWSKYNHFAYADRDGFVHVMEVMYKK